LVILQQKIENYMEENMIKRLFWFLLVILICAYVSVSYATQKSNLYRNKTYAFSIIFPDGWQHRGGQTPHTVVVSENLKGESIIIQVWQLPKIISLEDFSEKELYSFISNSFDEIKSKYNGAIMEGSGITYIANKKATWILFSYTIRHAFTTAKVKTMNYQVFHNGKMFQIACSSQSDRYKQFEGVFLNSVRTFIFEDPLWYKFP